MLTLVDHFKRVPIGVKDVRRVIAWIIFQPSTRRNIVLGASGNRSLVKSIDQFLVLGHKSPMDGCRVGVSLLQPEEGFFAVTEPPKIGMSTCAFVGHEHF